MNQRSLVLIAASLLMSACMTARVDMKYAPTDEAEPIRAGRMLKLYVPAVDDRSGGFQYHGGGATRSGELVHPLTDTIHDAVLLGMTRAGVSLVDSRKDAGAVFKAAVIAANISTREGVNQPMTAVLSVAFQLRSLAGELLWSNEITGQGVRTVAAAGFPGEAPTLTMNDGLVDLMRKLHRALEQETVFDRVFRTAAPAAVAQVAAAPAAPGPVRPEPSDLDALPAAGAARPHAHAVVIGIERYREGLPNADFAVGDARLAAEYFKRVLGVPPENVALLIDDHATNVDFQKYFERWLPNRVHEGDEVFVYFSGHGAPNPAKGDAYMVPYDGDPTYIEQTGYSVKRMYDQLAKLPAKKVLVVMDSCFSGAGGRSVLAKGARPLVSLQTSEVPARITVLSASAGDQISNSYTEKGHGLFTYYLLKGMKNKGADFRAVYGYLKPEVSRVAREQYNADQDPQWREGK